MIVGSKYDPGGDSYPTGALALLNAGHQKPGAQGVHAANHPGEYVPTEQGSGDPTLVGHAYPGGHAVQLGVPPVLYVPRPQMAGGEPEEEARTQSNSYWISNRTNLVDIDICTPFLH